MAEKEERTETGCWGLLKKVAGWGSAMDHLPSMHHTLVLLKGIRMEKTWEGMGSKALLFQLGTTVGASLHLPLSQGSPIHQGETGESQEHPGLPTQSELATTALSGWCLTDAPRIKSQTACTQKGMLLVPITMVFKGWC